MESEKGHQNSQQQESLIAHNLYLGEVRWTWKTRNTNFVSSSLAPISANPVSISKKYERSVKLLKLSFRCNFPQISILIFKKVTRVNNNYSLFKKIRKRILLCLPFDACMQPFHDNILMQSGFLLFPISSQSRMSISHTHGHRGPHGGPKTTRDIPKVPAFCFVRLTMLV